MLEVFGSIPIKNKDDRKKKQRSLKQEFGESVIIWKEGKMLFYQYKVNPDTIYL